METANRTHPGPSAHRGWGAWWLFGTLAQIGLLIVTAIPSLFAGLGIPTWHHNATLVGALLFSAVFWRRMTTDRRFLGMGVLVTTFLALASAFLLLYLKQDLKEWELKDWAKFWHVAWSWFALVFFLGHTWVNRHGMARSIRRISQGLQGIAFYGLLALMVAAVPVTWSPWGAKIFTDPMYIPLTLWTWLFFLVPTYSAWLTAAIVTREVGRPAWWSRGGTQTFVDSWLLPMTILANVTGFPILYFGTKDTTLKYVAKYWHTWPSIAMAILVFAHTVQFLPAVMAYSKKTHSPEPK